MGSAGTLLLTLALAPLALAALPLFLAAWLLLTLSCVGPLAQHACVRADDALLARSLHPSPGACVRLVPVTPGGRRLAVRWTPAPAAAAGSSARPHPVCIPNGLGATLVTISALHERLVALGFAVLSYDRAGVGMSEARSEAGHAGAEEVVSDMRAVMEHACPGATWLLVGPSMGSIVAQCYVAQHPASVVGVLNSACCLVAAAAAAT
jgi:pimeloyl-ACP methyl ester carboxylesterase